MAAISLEFDVKKSLL